jgi:hypothetical protein
VTVKRISVGLRRRGFAATLTAGLIGGVMLASGSDAVAAVRLTLPRLNASGVSANAQIRDTIIHRRSPLAVKSRAGFGGRYPTADGFQPTIVLSPAYVPDRAFSQSLANFFGTLLHGDELNLLTVYVAPYDEMQADCGSSDVDSCYDTATETIHLVGDTPPDGAPMAAIAAHEYGHHIANNRDNSPWDAGAWGPKYWATDEGVCALTRAGLAFPGDEGDHYAVNPGEAWAETYRILNGENPFSWPILDDLFEPNQKALEAARRDVLEPWGGNEYVDHTGRLSRHRRLKLYSMPVENDGTIDVSLRSRGSLDADLYLYKNGRARKPLAKSVRPGHRDRIEGSICGLRHIQVAVFRYKGSGSFTVRTALPYTNSA